MDMVEFANVPRKEPPPCRFYAIGKCNKATGCPFSHNLAAAKPVICKYFQSGDCKYGATCIFEHTMLPGNVCKFYQTGDCKFGDTCTYQHVVPDTGAPGAEVQATLSAVCVQARAQGLDPNQVLDAMVASGQLTAAALAAFKSGMLGGGGGGGGG
eukprot:CAMPEP_0206412648 /NCGR_PEP_ID=MMETSP0294-20121207/34153_1 /ASSEMBLY_ACC=CAM_ASM_000327 /TAXON_ID=39354 /ORGANISM="Heterosigma akashiwo, Strain CCMP2393" /LENGTH=154 /DNA_ID=CAMNT_0053873905 /DNA_START=89 /DNA_END=550 /DNA_ORIENTATION=-